MCLCEEGYFYKNGICGNVLFVGVRSMITNKFYNNVIDNWTVTFSRIVPSVRLGETCERGDVCQGDRSDCIQGSCQCIRLYKQLSGQCG